MFTIEWHGQTLHLLPERALFWPRGDRQRGVLVVADLHIGKAAAFRAAGIPVPEVIDADLALLSALIERERPGVLLIAGDLLHARSGRSDVVLDKLGRWRASHAQLEFILVRGNHDRSAGDPPSDLNIRVEDEPFTLSPGDPLAFAHDPDAPSVLAARTPTICGHLHPSITLGDGRTSLRVPCFWLRPHELVLPARGRFTGTRGIRPAPSDRVFVVGDDGVFEAHPRPVNRPVVRASGRVRTH